MHKTQRTIAGHPFRCSIAWMAAAALAAASGGCAWWPGSSGAATTVAAPAQGAAPITAVPKPAPQASSVSAYRQALAQHIRSASADQAFEGVPPNPLYAIVVLTWQVDGEGKVTGLRVLRGAPHAPATDKLALESVRRAQTLPKPSSAVLRQGGGKRLTVLETWLFKDAKHFQLRTLAQNQAGE